MPTQSERTTPAVTLISGFLGSGKTTLLRRLLARADRRIGVIVNEFGALGIDGTLLAQHGASPLIELTGGCVCCVAGSDLLLALETLIDSGPLAAIAIETSGLAEPGALIRQLRSADVPLDTLVTLVSAADFDRVVAVSPLTMRQLQLADLILVTHTDLVAPQARQHLDQRLRSINRRAPIVSAVYGDIAPELIFSPRYDGSVPDLLPHQHSEFAAIDWYADLPLCRSALEQTLRQLTEQGLFRAKGIVFCTDSPWADEVHVVAGRVNSRALRIKERPVPLCRLVLIGRDSALIDARIALDACIDSDERVNQWRERLVWEH